MSAASDRGVHWIDTHCHLDAAEFSADRDAVIAAARDAGVTTLVVPAVAAANFADVRACCRRYSACLPAWGIHPMLTDRARDEDLSTLRDWLRQHRPLAVGEIGLDGFVPGLDMSRQEHFFVEQLKLAKEFDLPVLLHIRRAQDLVLKYLRRVGVRGGIAHAFNGSRQQADEFIRLGFKLGFGGAMTYPRATRIRALAAELPIEAIVLETDAPDIPPAFSDSRRNVPANLPAIGANLAELRGQSSATVAEETGANAREVLGISGNFPPEGGPASPAPVA
jgi:TatD DNase family protein